MCAAVDLPRLLRSLATLVSLAVTLLLWAENAEARLKAELSFDGDGAWVFAPATIADAAPIVVAALDHPAAAGQPAHPGGSLGDLFSRPGLLAGFAAGFLGAGPLGMLFGLGLYGGLGGVASVLGLIFQLSLLAMLLRLIWTWWNGRNAPVFAGLSPRQQAEAYLRSRNELLPGIYPAAADTSDGDAAASNAGSAQTSAHNQQG